MYMYIGATHAPPPTSSEREKQSSSIDHAEPELLLLQNYSLVMYAPKSSAIAALASCGKLAVLFPDCPAVTAVLLNNLILFLTQRMDRLTLTFQRCMEEEKLCLPRSQTPAPTTTTPRGRPP